MTYNPSDWKPGDIAVVTCADEDVPSFVTEKEGRLTWHHVGHSFFKSTAVTNTHYNTAARRLVVIDPEDREEVERLARELMETTDRLQAALREFAKPTPPKPEEPTGLAVVVRDNRGKRWTRVKDGFAWRWRDDHFGEQASWDVIAQREPVVIFEGVTA